MLIIIGLEGTNADGPGHVYMAGEVTLHNGAYTGLFKVGFTHAHITISDKLKSMRTYNARRFEMIYYIPVTMRRAAEAAAHRALRPWHVNAGGGKEWFMVDLNNYQNWNNFRNQFLNSIQGYIRRNAMVIQ